MESLSVELRTPLKKQTDETVCGAVARAGRCGGGASVSQGVDGSASALDFESVFHRPQREPHWIICIYLLLSDRKPFRFQERFLFFFFFSFVMPVPLPGRFIIPLFGKLSVNNDK